MAISKILYGQYHIGYIWVSYERQFFFCRKQQLNHGQGTDYAKMGANSFVKNTQNTPKYIRLSYIIGPKV